MDSKDIQKRVDALSKAMIKKGLREPSARFSFASDEEATIYLRWKEVTSLNKYSNDEYKFFKCDTLVASLKEADDFVSKLPSADEAKLQQFMGALANVIDLGKGNGIEVEFLNPLQATMKKLSDNILTDQRAA